MLFIIRQNLMNSRIVLGVHARQRLKRLFAPMILIILVLAAFQVPVAAARNACHASSPVSAAYSVTVCITTPTDGAIISGVPNATIPVAGPNPGVAKLVFYLGWEYLLTDFQTPFTFSLPTTKWVDGSRLLEVEALMKDGFTA